MFSELSIANFKAFGAEQRIPLRRITLLYGPNSSGKSTVIHSLALLRAVLGDEKLEPLNPRLGTGARSRPVQLGAFKNFVFRQYEGHEVTIGVELRLEDSPRLRESLTKAGTALPDLLRLDITLAHPAKSPVALTGYCLQADGKPILMLRRAAADRYLIDELDAGFFTGRDGTEAERARVAEHRGHAASLDVMDAGKEKAAGFETHWEDSPRDLRRILIPESLRGAAITPETAPDSGVGAPAQTDADRPARGLANLMVGFDATARAIVEMLGRAVYIDTTRTYPEETIPSCTDSQLEFRPLDWAWNAAVYDDEVRALVTKWLTDPQLLGTSYEIGLAPTPEDEEPATGWMQVVFHDTQYHMDLRHRDVGYGVSQIVPVLATLRGESRLFIIDQPELHLHPRMQTEIADVLVDSALRKGNRYILETHSEHVLLRLMRRIRETTEGKIEKGSPLALSPADVSVVYLSPGENGTIATSIELTPNGEFGTRWPNGFFPERAMEWFS